MFVSVAIWVQGPLADLIGEPSAGAKANASSATAVPPQALAAAAEEAQMADRVLSEQEVKEEGEPEKPRAPNAVLGDHPVPPYDASVNIEDGLQCYYPGCKYQSKAWGKLLDHVKNSHKQKYPRLAGTYFHTMGLQDKMTQQAAKRKRDKDARKGAPKKNEGEPQGAERGQGSGGGSSSKKKRAGADGAAEFARRRASRARAAGASSAEVEYEYWGEMLCWVKCDEHGTPVAPMQYGGLVGEAGSPEPATQSARQASKRSQADFAQAVYEAWDVARACDSLCRRRPAGRTGFHCHCQGWWPLCWANCNWRCDPWAYGHAH